MPKRIQRSRAKGWKKPADAVYVGRSSIWGNPFPVGSPSGFEFNDGGDRTPMIESLTLEKSLEFYREMFGGFICPEMHPHGHQWHERFVKRVRGAHPSEWARAVLKGKDLMCWCDLDKPCHADVLLELANPPQPQAVVGAPGVAK